MSGKIPIICRFLTRFSSRSSLRRLVCCGFNQDLTVQSLLIKSLNGFPEMAKAACLFFFNVQRVDQVRRQKVIPDKAPYETGEPIFKNTYEISRRLTIPIYDATIYSDKEEEKGPAGGPKT